MVLNRDAILRCIIAIDFLYTSMALMTNWLPMSYSLNQMTIILLGFWAIVHRDSAITLMVIKCFSIILDSIAIGMHFDIGRRYYRSIDHSSYFIVSAFFAIFLVILKPIMLLFLNKVRQDRLGDASSPTFGGWASNTSPVAGYMPVDEQQAT
ncbi:unnamed protein product [Rotaria sp. Silwood1]|nr:unnamed protein product [Rotaria sp. Silwood1]CAF1574672.1 unnamed protein product [Rotaria sp. Silwood1]CAF3637656.1 unnamed protein product [Rotaria sp. Silwood1]CAF4715040.1 unnamed protein product [Rotaria sp. Silwood1]